MPDQPPTTCPLCLKPAPIIATTNFRRNKVFDCKDCGQFGVSDDADARIRGLPVQDKDDWRAKIHATKPTKPDVLFVIIIRLVGSAWLLDEERIQRHAIESLP